jgi:hypothetical protein
MSEIFRFLNDAGDSGTARLTFFTPAARDLAAALSIPRVSALTFVQNKSEERWASAPFIRVDD